MAEENMHIHTELGHHALREADLDHVAGGGNTTSEQTYKCGCGKTFASREALAAHKRKEGHI